MKKSLLIIANLIAITCAMRSWQFNIHSRLIIYDVITVAFILVWLIRYFIEPRSYALNTELKIFLLLVWLYFAVVILSGIKIILIYDSPESFIQFYKGLFTQFTFAIFASFFCMFMSELEPKKRKQILMCFITGVVLSSLYGVMSIILYKAYSIKIEDYFWHSVSYNSEVPLEEGMDWAVMGFRRGIGFSGYASSATYNMTIIPLLMLFIIYFGKLRYYLLFTICFVGLIVTMSRTGFIAFAVSLVVLFVLSLKNIKSAIFKFLIIFLPLMIIGFIWSDYITEIFKVRTDFDYSRYMIWQSGSELFLNDPFMGVGTNNYSVVRFTLPHEYYHLADLHNSWLSILVELGILGFICYSLFLSFIIWRATIKLDILSKGIICTIITLSVGALGNQIFDLFYFKYFLILLFSMVSLGDGKHIESYQFKNLIGENHGPIHTSI